ncbi:flagellar biosynthesis repressor FlbT [Geobacter sp. AOG2]|uniref:flagellar biosynthesis repressor FlbT n=1 Tax=Geobacter sp. AOG2 TaxID=1566347 RepID=UPI001CC52572|nr:flagellar biosynthesis repressor FlbT [Geobacter sp. AOG2]GFE59666.1 putative flagellum biosynthesis repressor protein FlbT 1 [Geobacter sp. AOG2]
MSLKLHLKPHEKIIIGGAVMQCGNRPIEFTVENNVPILRQKDIMTEAGATSPARRVYFVLQLMYIDSGANDSNYHEVFRELEREITAAVPSSQRFFDEISGEVAAGRFYQALKTAQALMAYENQLLAHVGDTSPPLLPAGN